MGLGLCSQRRRNHQPGLKSGTGKYAKRALGTAFNDKTNFTVLQFMQADRSDGVGLSGSSGLFSMWDGTNGMNIKNFGINLYVTTDSSAFAPAPLMSRGSGGGDWAGVNVTGQRATLTFVWAWTFDASLGSNESKAYTYGLSNVTSGKDFKEINEGIANLGTIADTDIRIGNTGADDDGNVAYACAAGVKFCKTAIWYSTLTVENIEALVNYDSSMDAGKGSMIYDVSGRKGAIGYTELGIAQPNHEWVPTWNDPDQTDLSSIVDTGSTGGEDLSLVGSPMIATIGKY